MTSVVSEPGDKSGPSESNIVHERIFFNSFIMVLVTGHEAESACAFRVSRFTIQYHLDHRTYTSTKKESLP